ncbi:matrix metalloproteinase-17-like isoform X2 [Carettochelys insculpta]|uniref:matrix metalloproteinase-17-like isoform X2 n=1 Tax=Carettochelys insculpta TaxID=44489 RepID=UPI003EBC6E6E
MEQRHRLELRRETPEPPVSAQLAVLLSLLWMFPWPVGTRPAPTPADESGEVVAWLTQYGYLPPAEPGAGQLQTWEAVTSAIRAMQRFAGIPESGIPDDATLALLRTPRCSLPDVLPHRPPQPGSGRQRRKRRRRWGRRRAGLPWAKRSISWTVKTYPRELRLSRDTVRALIHYALQVWAAAAPLTFHEVGGPGADVAVEFLRLAHRDGHPFDGPGGGVAHAFFPSDPQRAGHVHFDSDEDWTFRSPGDSGTDLFAVAVHEFGHSLGLAHSPSARSIMRPYYQGPVGDPLQYQLQADDRADIQELYGSHVLPATENSEVAMRLPDPPSQPHDLPALRSEKGFPDRCSSNPDAVARIRGETFFFQGPYFWRLSHGRHLASRRPALSAAFWRGLPHSLPRVDAVYERHTDHRILFFSGPLYWVFKDNGAEEGYPRPITDFGLPPGGVDAAFSSPHDGKTYFFKGGLQWRYDEAAGRMDKGSPTRPLLWGQLPALPDDMLSGSDGEVYAFQGRRYWKLDWPSRKLEPGYPRSIARDWLGCKGELHLPPSALPSAPAGAKLHPAGRGPPPEVEHCLCPSSAPRAAGGWMLAVLLLLRGLG